MEGGPTGVGERRAPDSRELPVDPRPRVSLLREPFRRSRRSGPETVGTSGGTPTPHPSLRSPTERRVRGLRHTKDSVVVAVRPEDGPRHPPGLSDPRGAEGVSEGPPGPCPSPDPRGHPHPDGVVPMVLVFPVPGPRTGARTTRLGTVPKDPRRRSPTVPVTHEAPQRVVTGLGHVRGRRPSNHVCTPVRAVPSETGLTCVGDDF